MKIGDVVSWSIPGHPRMTVEEILPQRSPAPPVADGLPGMPGVAVYEGEGPIPDPVDCVWFDGERGPFRGRFSAADLKVVS